MEQDQSRARAITVTVAITMKVTVTVIVTVMKRKGEVVVRNVQRIPIDDDNDDEYARRLTRSFLVSCCRSLRPADSNEPR